MIFHKLFEYQKGGRSTAFSFLALKTNQQTTKQLLNHTNSLFLLYF